MTASKTFTDVGERRALLGGVVNWYELRAVLCDYCDGFGYVHEDSFGHTAISMLRVPHKTKLPGIEPCFDCMPCPECGRDGCGPGVRWVEVSP